MDKRNLFKTALESEAGNSHPAIQEKEFRAEMLRQPHWMKDSQRFSYLGASPDGDGIVLWMYDIRNAERKQIIPANALTLPKDKAISGKEDPDEAVADKGNSSRLQISGYGWSPDESRILIARATAPPHAAVTGDKDLYLFTLATGQIKRVMHHTLPHRNVKWSPDGKYIGYVRADDLYVLEIASLIEMRLTDSAAPTVFNGRFGWVYEEEFDLVDGWEWSPDGRHIAYYQYDETQTPVVPLTDFNDLHLKPRLTRYPKPGDPNPRLRIGFVEAPGTLSGPLHSVPQTRWADLGMEADIHIVWIQWMPSGKLLVHRMNRIQNKLDLLKLDPMTGKAELLLSETDRAWIEAWELSFEREGGYKLAAHIIAASGEFIWKSDRDGYCHLYLYDAGGKLLRQLTSGAWDVDDLVGLDSTHRVAFFTAARPSALERQIYSVLLDGGGEIMQVSEGHGTHTPLFAPDMQHFLDTHSSWESPPAVRLHRASGRKITAVQENAHNKGDALHPGDWEFGSLSTSDGVSLNYAMLKPPDFDLKKRYPVMMYTYGGPGFQVVRDTWGIGSGYEANFAQLGVICVLVDGRGSGMRGRDFLKTVHGQLGKWEVHDQIEAAKWLAARPFVDPRRIGIWGGSYGGYMASLCILRGVDVFKLAMAVAPVTHWSLYDSIYTERYMRLPKDNPVGYETTTPLNEVSKLKGKFLLVHGLADDNVHFQNTVRLAEALQKHGKSFQTMFYPGEDHSLSGVEEHLQALLIRFVRENL